MKATFQNTVDILVKAYLNHTLFHGRCNACAVGNIIASSCDLRVDYNNWTTEDGAMVFPQWDSVFVCDFPTKTKIQSIYKDAYEGEAKDQIDSTGYTWRQLAKVEKAFELHSDDHTGLPEDEAMFNGLMAVVDVLAEIHNIDLTAKESAKLLFIKA